MTKRFLLLTGEFPPFGGGIANLAKNLAEALAKAGGDVTVIAPSIRREGKERRPYCLIQLPFLRLRYVRMVPMTPLLVALAAKVCPDWVIGMRVTREGIPALAIKKCLGVPVFLFAHGLEFLRFQPSSLLGRVCQWLFERADLIGADSKAIREELLRRGVSPEKVCLVRPGLDEGFLHPVAPLTHWGSDISLRGRKVLLTVGRLVPRKGVDKVIEALPFVLKVFPETLYFVVGDGPYRVVLEEKAKELGVQGHVVFTGRVSDSRPFYRACNLFVMPTREEGRGDLEGFGLVYLEAAASGKPVIASLTGGVTDAVVPDETALIVDPHDPKDIATAIIRLLSDEALAKRLGEMGRRRVLREFTYERVVKQLLRAIGKVEGQGEPDGKGL